jgi:N4-(beta-N-acetylglucosaminyl)-L-asparaginase
VIATSEARLLDDQGRPMFGLNFYAVNKNGDFGGASFTPGARYSSWDGENPQHYDAAYLFERNR